MLPTGGGLPMPFGTDEMRSARSPDARISTSLVTVFAADDRVVSVALKFAARVRYRAREYAAAAIADVRTFGMSLTTHDVFATDHDGESVGWRLRSSTRSSYARCV